jgi:hypothetical protein
MTTQIVLGNGYGLAVATDSAVTVGDRRTYETSEKLILLGEPHCIAALVSGAVTQFSLPIQVLVAEWIKTIKNVQLRKATDYRESFVSWLRDNMSDFPDPDTRMVDAFWQVDSYLRICWNDISAEAQGMDTKQRTQTTIDYLEHWIERHQQFRKIDQYQEMGGDNGALKILDELWEERKDWWPGINARLGYWFDDVEPASLQRVKELARLLLLRRIGTWWVFGDLTKVAFAGYGAKEMIPSYASVQLFGGYREWLTGISDPPLVAENIGGKGYFLLETIGQTDYIDNILLGYRSDLIDSAAGVLEDAQRQNQIGVETQEMSGLQQPTSDHDIKQQLKSAVEQGAEERMLRPLRQAVSAMPLKSLAEAARSLVGVQALGKAISAELPTTGGKIEVAVISRAEGVRVITQ